MVLAHVKKIAEAFLGRPMPQAIISVPAYYNDNQRHAVKEAGRLAGFEVKRIVNEPTAAALAYGFNRGLDQKVLVYDLGGGTFDVSVLQLSAERLRGAGHRRRHLPRAAWTSTTGSSTGCSTSSGGSTRSTSPSRPSRMQRVKNAAEAAKIDLSLIPNMVIDLPFIEEKKGKPLDLRMPLSRQQLDELTQRPRGPDLPALRRGAGARRASARSDIDEIILVGGQSRMPLVQQRIREHFGKPPRKGVHPDECVALGAALLGDSLDSIDSVTLVDVLSMPIGIAAAERPDAARCSRRTRTIPATRSFRLPPPREPGQPIEIDIYQGDSDQIVDDEFLGSLRLPAAATGRRIDFKLDEECLLRVTFDDPERGMVEVPFATRDTPEALRRAIAEKTPPPARGRGGAARAAARALRVAEAELTLLFASQAWLDAVVREVNAPRRPGAGALAGLGADLAAVVERDGAPLPARRRGLGAARGRAHRGVARPRGRGRRAGARARLRGPGAATGSGRTSCTDGPTRSRRRSPGG